MKRQEIQLDSFFTRDVVLMETQYTPITWIVQDILPSGLAMLAGKPKHGKSFLCLDLAIHVALGQSFWGYATHHGEALYLSLEDDARIVKKNRMQLSGLCSIPNLYYGFEFPKGNDAIQRLQQLIHDNPNLKLIIIDIIGCVIPYMSGDQSNKYDFISNSLEQFKMILKDTGVCLLFTHHTSKKDYALSQDKVLGSTAYQAKVDTFMVLEKKDDSSSTLSIDGKFMQGSKTLLLSRNENGSFSIMGERNKPVSEMERLLEIVKSSKTPLSPKQASVIMQKDTTILNQMLHRLFKQGLITKLGKGQYISLDYELRTGYSPFNL